MNQPITQSEIDRLRAPFPLAAHSIREGNKVRGGQGIQWFVYVEKTEVENRLNEVFPGEWGSSQPVLYPMGNAMAATISITIRGITRGNTGEDSNGTEKAKGATTDAFRRAAADWGIAKYLWEMDFQIYTDTYPDKDWKARDAREKDAMDKFTTWYNKKFKGAGVTPLNAPQPEKSAAEKQMGNGHDQPRNLVKNAPTPPVASNSGNSEGVWIYDLPSLMSHPDLNTAYPQYTHRANAIKLLHDGGFFANVANLSEAVKVVLNRPDKQAEAG